MEATATSARTPSGSPGAQDALALLKRDHEEIEQLFAQCEPSSPQSGTPDRSDLVRRICRELKVHAEVEEQMFYPELYRAGIESRLIGDARQEHAEAKELIATIESTNGAAGAAPLAKLIQGVRHHVHEEESLMFPAARRCGIDLNALGERLAEFKRQVAQRMRS